MTATVGFDIGGTSVRAIAFDDTTGAALARSLVPTDIGDGTRVVSSVLEAWSELRLAEPISSAGVGVPGRVDPKTGDVRMAVNLGIGEEPFPLGAELARELGTPVAVENDVKVAALGVYEELRRQGSAPGSLVLLNIGTGISAGVVIDGALFRGSHGMAGEIGHVVVEEEGPLCRCGQRGCLEAVAAGPAIARLWPEAGSRGAPFLFETAGNGVETALQVAGYISKYVALAITWLAAAFDAEQIFLGGGVSKAGRPFLDAVREKLRNAALNSSLAAQRIDPASVTLAPIDGSTGPRGAAVLAQRLQPLSLASKGTSNPSNGGEI